MAERDPPRLRRGFDPFRPLHNDAGAMTSGNDNITRASALFNTVAAWEPGSASAALIAAE